MRLTPAVRHILEYLIDDSLDQELVECGGEVWYGEHKTNHTALRYLNSHILISEDGTASSDDYHVFHINEWGRRALSDPIFDAVDELERLISERQKGGDDDE